MKKKKKSNITSQTPVALRKQMLARKSKHALVAQVVAMSDRIASQANEIRDLRHAHADADIKLSRLQFMLGRHSALEEWANAARRVVFSFPGVDRG